MDLSNLKPAEGSTHKKKRLGRGVGSGDGGHSSTRGTKGQGSRSGSRNRPIWFEYSIANVSRLARLVEEGRLDADEPVTPEVLESAGAIRSAERVKILGDGEIDVALEISAHAFSASAKEKIEAAGGTATVIE